MNKSLAESRPAKHIPKQDKSIHKKRRKYYLQTYEQLEKDLQEAKRDLMQMKNSYAALAGGAAASVARLKSVKPAAKYHTLPYCRDLVKRIEEQVLCRSRHTFIFEGSKTFAWTIYINRNQRGIERSRRGSVGKVKKP